MIKLLLALAIFCFSTVTGWAATHLCGTDGVNNSCGTSDFSNTLSRASNGDTIIIANATHNWSSYVTINKRVTIDGGGSFATNANHENLGTWKATINLNNASGINGFIIQCGSGTGRVRIKGLKITGNTRFTYSCSRSDPYGAIWVQNDNLSEYILDNNFFNLSGVGGNGLGGIIINATIPFGLISKNYFQNAIYHGHTFMVQRCGNSGCGDESWNEDEGWGTANFVYIEDNIIKNPGGAITPKYPGPVIIDAQAGGKYVFRYNYVEQGYMGNHGEGSGGYCGGGYAFEVYNNSFKWLYTTDRWSFLYYWRGGSLRFFNNRVEGYQTMVRSWVERATSGHVRWGQCSSANAWDGPGPPNGYPCLGAPGMGHRRTLVRCPDAANTNEERSPGYIYNNTASNMSSGALGVLCERRDYDPAAKDYLTCHNNPTYTVSNVDYYFSTDNSAVPVGYKPYVYPHPLSNPGDLAPVPPSNLRIVQ